MKYRNLVRAMRKHGCLFLRPGKGDHEIWACPCGRHWTSIVKDTEVSTGVVVDAIRNLACLPEGWWK